MKKSAISGKKSKVPAPAKKKVGTSSTAFSKASGKSPTKLLTAPPAPEFKIPKKKVEVEFFQNVDMESREYLSEILPILTRNCARPPHSREVQSFRFTKCTMVHNDALLDKFEEKRREMRAAKTDVTISYGFWHAFNGEEVTSICKNGLSANYSLGTLGKSDLGAYVSQQADVLTAAPLLDGVHGTFIVFKILKGRVKLVPVFKSGHLEPAPNYECHGPKPEASTSTNAETSPYRMFESNLLYLYDYVDVDLQTPPRNVCPIAIIEYIYEDRTPSPHWLKNEQLLWTGALRFEDGSNEDFEANLRLTSHLSKMKPPYLQEHLMIKMLVDTNSCLQWTPIKELRRDGIQGVMYKQKRDLRLNSGHFVTVYRLSTKTRSEKFVKLIFNMYQNHAIGLASAYEGTAMLVFPSSHFSCQLGIPPIRDVSSSLYCLVFGYRSLVTGMGYVRDPYDTSPLLDLVPANADILDPNKLMEITQVCIDAHLPSGVKKLTATTVPKIDHAAPQPVPHPSSPFDAIATHALLRDPRMQRRLQTTGINNGQHGSAQESNGETRTGSMMALDQPVDFEDPNSCFADLGEPIEVDMEMEPAREPRIVPLESTEDGGMWESPDGPSGSAGYGRIANEEQGRISTSKPGASKKVGRLDNKVLNIIYGGSVNKRRHSTDDETTAKRPRCENERDGDAAYQTDDIRIDYSGTAISEATSTTTASTSTIIDRDPTPPVQVNTLPRSVVVPDDLVLTKADPVWIKKILEAFDMWKKASESDWCLKLHSQVVIKLASIKKNLSPSSIQHKKVTDILILCHQYRQTGVVELLPEHECDKESRSAAEYLPCLRQRKAAEGDVQYILLSNLHPDGDVGKDFLAADILVFNVQKLCEHLKLDV